MSTFHNVIASCIVYCSYLTSFDDYQEDVKPFLGRMPRLGLMVKVAGLSSLGPEFKPLFFHQNNTRWVDSVCHPSKVSKMNTSLLGVMSHLSILCQSGDLSRIVLLSKMNLPQQPCAPHGMKVMVIIIYFVIDTTFCSCNMLSCEDVRENTK